MNIAETAIFVRTMRIAKFFRIRICIPLCSSRNPEFLSWERDEGTLCEAKWKPQNIGKKAKDTLRLGFGVCNGVVECELSSIL